LLVSLVYLLVPRPVERGTDYEGLAVILVVVLHALPQTSDDIFVAETLAESSGAVADGLILPNMLNRENSWRANDLMGPAEPLAL
jgi:hypothetical protein